MIMQSVGMPILASGTMLGVLTIRKTSKRKKKYRSGRAS
jgi:hypothetical protein